jgi:hypothetical protein
MALPIVKFSIDGKDYASQLWPAREALVLLPKIIHLVGKEVFSLILSQDDLALEKLAENSEVVAALVCTLSERAVAQDDGLLLFAELMRRTTCAQIETESGKTEANVYDHFDNHFAGDIIGLIKVAVAVARASFAKP